MLGWIFEPVYNNITTIGIVSVLLYLIRIIFLTGYFTPLKKSMKGKIVIVTGASAGIGKATAFQLLKDGAEVIYACRNKEKTMKVFDDIEKIDKTLLDKAHFMLLDLSSFKSVIEFSKNFQNKYKKVDILINNAATFPRNFKITEDNIESVFQENYFSLVLLCQLLIDSLDKNEGRILNLASFAHVQCDYTEESINILKKDSSFTSINNAYFSNMWTQHYHYSNTKTAIIYYTSHLSEILAKKYPHIKAVSVNPVLVYTEFARFFSEHEYGKYIFKVLFFMYKYIAKTPIGGAQSSLHCCYLDFKDLLSGAYYSDCKLGKLSRLAKDKKIRDMVMEYTFEILNKNQKTDYSLN